MISAVTLEDPQATVDAIYDVLMARADVRNPFPFCSDGRLVVQGWVKDESALADVTRVIGELAPDLPLDNRLRVIPTLMR
jgi:hypothetical protein